MIDTHMPLLYFDSIASSNVGPKWGRGGVSGPHLPRRIPLRPHVGFLSGWLWILVSGWWYAGLTVSFVSLASGDKRLY